MTPFRWIVTALYIQVLLGLARFIVPDCGFRLDRRDRLDQCREGEAALAALPVGQRVALVQRRYHGRSYAEIAATLHCSEDAARASVYAALRTLRDSLDDQRCGFDPSPEGGVRFHCARCLDQYCWNITYDIMVKKQGTAAAEAQ